MVNLKQIEKDIVDFIEKHYECKFTGTVKVEMPQPDTYYVRLRLNQPERPIQVTIQGDYDFFWDRIQFEIRQRRLNETEYFSGYQFDKPTKQREEDDKRRNC